MGEVFLGGVDPNEILEELFKNEEEFLSFIEDHFGKKARERVEIFKEYKKGVEKGEIKESILPVFGGMPSVGKTSMSSFVSRVLGINVVMGGDQFRAVLREFIKKEENPAFFVSVYKAWTFFGDFNEENVIKGFNAQARVLNTAVERLVVDRGIRDGESVSVDFLHFLPSLWHKETLEHPSVVPFVLYVSDEEVWKGYIRNRVKNHLKGRWKRIINALEIYRIIQEFQLRDAEKSGVNVIDTSDFERAKEEVLDVIFQRVKRLVELKVWDKPHPMIEEIKKERRE